MSRIMFSKHCVEARDPYKVRDLHKACDLRKAHDPREAHDLSKVCDLPEGILVPPEGLLAQGRC